MTRSLIDQVKELSVYLEKKQKNHRAQDRMITPIGDLTAICDACGDVGRIAECTRCEINICLTTAERYLGCILSETLADEAFLCPLCYFKDKKATPVCHYNISFNWILIWCSILSSGITFSS
jgi:hypothetical protein